MNILESIEKRSSPLVVFLGFLLIGVIGVIDLLTGYEFAFSIFYVVPIFLITWVANKQMGFAASIASAVTWLLADEAPGHVYSHPFVPVWNTLIRLSFFVIITYLLSSLKDALQREKELARIDQLTTAVNSRYFRELVQLELDRSQRSQRQFTLAYIDLDNFKGVNDRFGHMAGDLALSSVVNSIKKMIRKTDVVSRLGGDEFALLLPETDQASASTVMNKLLSALTAEMQKNGWQITFSVGVLTCRTAPHTPDELLNLADKLMYQAKSSGKNKAVYSMYEG